MKKFQILTAIALTVALGFANCGGSADADKKKKNNNLLILAAFLSQSRSSPEAFYQVLSSKTDSYAVSATAISSNTKTTWAFNSDKSIQTITSLNTGVGSADGTVNSITVNTYAGGNLIRSVVTPTGVTAGTCNSATGGNGAYTLENSNFSGKNAQTQKCTPGTTTSDTITNVSTYENGVVKTQASTRSVNTANNSFFNITYTSGVMTKFESYSGATTADATKLSSSFEAVVTGTSIVATNYTHNPVGSARARTQTTEYTIAGDNVTRVLTTNFNAATGVITSSNLDVYAYTGNTSFTKKSYSNDVATPTVLVTEVIARITNSSANTYVDGRLTQTQDFIAATGAVSNTTTYTYLGDKPLTRVITLAAFPTFNSCTAYVFTDSTKTVTVTSDSGTTTCTGATIGRTVKTIVHNDFDGTNFNGFTNNESRSATKDQKVNFFGAAALQNGENNKMLRFVNDI